jgi:putative transposase
VLVPGGRKGKRGPRTDNRLSTHCFGWRVRAAGGVICPRGLGSIIRSSGAITAGSRWAFWRSCSRRWPGKPIWIGGPGQENDITHAHELIDGFAAAATIADKAYDANHLHDKIVERGSEIVIPPKRNRKVQRSYDVDLYKERNLIERFFNKLKQFRRVATRYDKLLVNFMGFVKLAAIAIWLR